MSAIIVPEGLSEDEQVAFIRKEMLARGIDPDSCWPIEIIDPSFKPVSPEGISFSVTFSYDKELP